MVASNYVSVWVVPADTHGSSVNVRATVVFKFISLKVICGFHDGIISEHGFLLITAI